MSEIFNKPLHAVEEDEGAGDRGRLNYYYK